ncbi:SAV_915 family protein [Streptomyces sp. NBC_01716]|uniref:SAV_915 family protein n=1 Tax=Streptomyces sp. NBC_01716 TaxID=2975917 RepID=UPI002E343DDF|nr:SAV_915 family protein [Streptomyces sp. NBC_01716]
MESTTHEDADPEERKPAGPLYIPVRLGSAGGHHLRFMRTPLGARTAVGFTSARRLTAALGPRQPYIRLAETCLRTLSEPLGVVLVTIDPQLAAAPVDRRTPAPGHAPARTTVRPCLRHTGGVPLAVGA